MVEQERDVLAPLRAAAASSISIVLSRNSRSCRKRFSSASCPAETLVAAITRTSIGIGLLAPTGTTCALLERGQQLGLEVERQIADLVEEQGAPVGGLEAADPLAGGAGERALDVTEQLGFEQGLARRAEVDRDHRLVGAARQAVDFARDDLLAGAVLAEDQDVGIGRRGALDQRSNALHRRRLAEQRRVRRRRQLATRGRARSARRCRLRRSAAALRTVASSRSLLHGLATKSLAPALIASTATDTRAVRGDDHDRGIGILLHDLAQVIETLAAVGRARARN